MALPGNYYNLPSLTYSGVQNAIPMQAGMRRRRRVIRGRGAQFKTGLVNLSLSSPSGTSGPAGLSMGNGRLRPLGRQPLRSAKPISSGRKRKRVVRRRRMQGGNFFNDVGNFFTKTIPNTATTVYDKALKPAGEFIKDKKILSTAASLIPHPAGKIGSVALGALGLGRRSRVRKRIRKRGGSVLSKIGNFAYHKVLIPAVKLAKQHKLISKGLSLVPNQAVKNIGKVAALAGLGRKRRVGRPRKGGSLTHNILKRTKLVSRGLRAISAPGSTLRRFADHVDRTGYGRKRRPAKRGRGPLLNMLKDGVSKARVVAKKLGYGRDSIYDFAKRSPSYSLVPPIPRMYNPSSGLLPQSQVGPLYDSNYSKRPLGIGGGYKYMTGGSMVGSGRHRVVMF